MPAISIPVILSVPHISSLLPCASRTRWCVPNAPVPTWRPAGRPDDGGVSPRRSVPAGPLQTRILPTLSHSDRTSLFLSESLSLPRSPSLPPSLPLSLSPSLPTPLPPSSPSRSSCVPMCGVLRLLAGEPFRRRRVPTVPPGLTIAAPSRMAGR